MAELVSRGYIRVIVTTNFDRLLERALVDAGVEPTVISTPDAAEGAIPLAHSSCTVMKVHGDYLDSRIKNTRKELEHYDLRIDSLLDRIFDEFGLIVCGWSSEWDAALRTALQRCKSHRFSTYWTIRETPTDEAASLISLRRARAISIRDADAFFVDLADKVLALGESETEHPLSARIAVAQLKRYLASSQFNIRIDDLMVHETERVYGTLFGGGLPLEGVLPTPGGLADRLRRYDSLITTLRDLMVCITYWGQKEHEPTWKKCFRRVATPPDVPAGYVPWEGLRLYPALTVLYAVGISSIAAEKYGSLEALLGTPVRPDRFKEEIQVARFLYQHAVMDLPQQRTLPGREKEFTPLSNHLYEALRDPFRGYLQDDVDYQGCFDWLEYLLALVRCDLSMRYEGRTWGPIGCFGWRNRDRASWIVRKVQVKEGEIVPLQVRLALQAGLFEGQRGQTARYVAVKSAFDDYLGSVISGWH